MEEQQSHMVQQPFQKFFFDQKSMNERLLELSMRTGYNCIQRNGQRIYGPPPNWIGEPPVKGSEVFIGRLPGDCFEDELVPIFESVAPIYEFRMMMNFTGFNRGFAFVCYCNPEDAWRAVSTLNNYEIRPGHKLGVSKSIDNCRLYVGNIPTTKNKAEAWDELIKSWPTIKEIIMYPNPSDRSLNRGFLFMEFDSHRTAAMVKQMMVPGTVKLWNQMVIVDWAKPEPDVDPNVMARVTKLFLRNLTPGFTTDRVRRILKKIVPMHTVQRIYVAGHYGFVHFDTRVNAELAKDRLAMVDIEGELLEVHWARPTCYRNVTETQRRNITPRLHSDQNREQNNNIWATPGLVQPEIMLQQPLYGSNTSYNGPPSGAEVSIVPQFPPIQYPVCGPPLGYYNPNHMSFLTH